MDLFSERPNIPQANPSSDEIVLRLFIQQLKMGYKEGWLYYRCKKDNLLKSYGNYQSRNIFELLKTEKLNYPEPKLTIELVPKTCWFSNVRSNVTQSEWNRFKKTTAEKADKKCEICGGQGYKWPVECHEIWHYDDNQLLQKLMGLIALCPSCHEVKHIGFSELRGKKIESACHLAIVNGWSYKKSCDYIEQQFKVWRERSAYPWLLDISWLEQFNITVNNPDRPESYYKNLPKDEMMHYMGHRKKAIDLFNEGSIYEKRKEYGSAFQCYKEASEYGDADAAFNLAIFYTKGLAVISDSNKAIEYIKKASHWGDQESSRLLSMGEDKLIQHFMLTSKQILPDEPAQDDTLIKDLVGNKCTLESSEPLVEKKTHNFIFKLFSILKIKNIFKIAKE